MKFTEPARLLNFIVGRHWQSAGVHLELPTDNLYKFIAVCGVALMVAATPMAISSQRKRTEFLAAHFRAATHILEENERLDTAQKENLDRAHFLKNHFGLTGLGGQDGDAKCSANPTCVAEFRKLEDAVSQVAQQAEDLRKQLSAELADAATIDVLDTQMQREYKLSMAGMIIGFLVASVGSILWYRRTQTPSDSKSRPKRSGRRGRP